MIGLEAQILMAEKEIECIKKSNTEEIDSIQRRILNWEKLTQEKDSLLLEVIDEFKRD